MAKTNAAAEAAEGEPVTKPVAGAEGADTVAADPAPEAGAQGADTIDANPAPEVAPELLPPAVVVTEFFGVPDGLVYPRIFGPGDVVLGDLGDVALREGWAERPAG
jgi:hypothetical protein